MKYGMTITLACAVIATGCQIVVPAQPPKTGTPPVVKPVTSGGGVAAIESKLRAGVKTPIAYTSRDEKVEVMAKAFTVSENSGLGTAATSFKKLATSLQNAFMARSAAMSAGGAPGMGAMVSQLRAESSAAVYAIAGLAESQQGDATFIYDEDTRELVAIKGPNAEIQFKFVNGGNKRSWEATIVKSPDGTTGTFSIEVDSSAWKAYNFPTATPPMKCGPYTPRPRYTPSYYPTAAPSYAPTPAWSAPPEAEPSATASGLIGESGGSYQVAQAYPSPGYTPDPNGVDAPDYEPGYDPNYDDDYEDPCGPDPNWVAPTPPPFKFAANEYPEFVDRVAFKFVVKPEGKDNLAFEMAGALDEAENVPESTMRIPTQWTYMARIPGVYFDWKSKLTLRPRNSQFHAEGNMLVEVEKGQEAFTYNINFNEGRRSGTFALNNVGAKVQLLVTADQGEYGGSSVHTRLLSLRDDGSAGAEMGTVEIKPGTYNVAVVKFNDGVTKEYEIFPQGLIPMGPPPMATQPAPAPTYY